MTIRGEKMQIAIEKRRTELGHGVQIAVHSTNPEEKQNVFKLLTQQFKLVKPKKGPHIVEGANSVAQVKDIIEEHFPEARFVSMTELEILGGLE
ncbi:MAG: hypothetical protein V1703_02585 [Candidatus Altiarchaeota archaeon]